MAPRRLIAAALAAAAALPAAAPAASVRDSFVRHHLSFQRDSALFDGETEGLSLNVVLPRAWTVVKRSRTHLSLHAGSAVCRYSVTFTTRLAEGSDETPEEHVTEALPVPASAYLLDRGARNAATAWRVTRLRVAGAVRLRAMRADRRTLGSGRRAWQETVVSATSRRDDECHTGTYRDSLGPQIGDALATATGRAYSYVPKSRSVG